MSLWPGRWTLSPCPGQRFTERGSNLMQRRWYRLCVDVDQAGNVIGLSAELHNDDEPIAEMVCYVTDPFLARPEAIEDLWSTVLELKGDQLRLW